jgi:hypothetical protein
MREDFRARNLMDDEDQPTAMVTVGPIVKPLGRKHRVLRRLNERRLPAAIGEADDALDPQQIAAPGRGEGAERAGKVEPGDVALQLDRDAVDAVAVQMTGDS